MANESQAKTRLGFAGRSNDCSNRTDLATPIPSTHPFVLTDSSAHKQHKELKDNLLLRLYNSIMAFKSTAGTLSRTEMPGEEFDLSALPPCPTICGVTNDQSCESSVPSDSVSSFGHEDPSTSEKDGEDSSPYSSNSSHLGYIRTQKLHPQRDSPMSPMAAQNDPPFLAKAFRFLMILLIGFYGWPFLLIFAACKCLTEGPAAAQAGNSSGAAVARTGQALNVSSRTAAPSSIGPAAGSPGQVRFVPLGADHASVFVQQFMNLYMQLEQGTREAYGETAASAIRPVVDCLPALAIMVERLIVLQNHSKAKNIFYEVDLGYHYTLHENIKSIQKHGLLTAPERTERGIQSKHNGSKYGEGVYCANNPELFQEFGPICIMMLRLKGMTSTSLDPNVALPCSYDDGKIIVCRSSAQCVPLIQFVVESGDLMQNYFLAIKEIVDKTFNDKQTAPSIPLQVGAALTANSQVVPLASSAPPGISLVYKAPNVLNATARHKIEPVMASSQHVDDCAICLLPLTDNVGELRGCGHRFHMACILQALERSYKCPTCNRIIVEPQGRMPSGRMTVMPDRYKDGSGNAVAEFITIIYHIPNGVQKGYHGSPGTDFTGTTRIAFVPNDSGGHQLLKRLQYAFAHGLTFEVGTSLATGRTNTVVWSSIHHKTQRSPGPHGLPDPGYYLNCNDELDALGVPQANDL